MIGPLRGARAPAIPVLFKIMKDHDEEHSLGPSDFIKEAGQFMEKLDEVSGVQLAFHDYAFLSQRRWPSSRYQHSCAYCQAVKRTPEGKRLCHHTDVVEAAAEARRIRRPFLRHCHAGVSEVIVPVLNGSELVAVIFVGQVFSRPNAGLTAIPATARKRVPVVHPKRLMAIATLVDLFFRTNRVIVESLTDLNRPSQFGPRKLMETLNWLQPQLCSNISVTQAARHAGISVSHFEHLFKLHMGVSLSEWRRLQRLRSAKHLLTETNLKVREIAAQVGYHDAAYFHRLFKQAEGISPQAFRKAIQAISDKQKS